MPDNTVAYDRTIRSFAGLILTFQGPNDGVLSDALGQVGLDFADVSSIQRLKTILTTRQLRTMADALGVTFEGLIDDAKAMVEIDEERKGTSPAGGRYNWFDTTDL